MPDLSFYIKEYVNSKSQHIKKNKSAAYEFNFHSGLGTKQSLKSVFSRRIRAFGNSEHLWMWDEESLIFELAEAGFVDISKFEPSNSDDPMFIAPERDHQFYGERHYGLVYKHLSHVKLNEGNTFSVIWVRKIICVV